jgi:hypothetical protein
MDADGRYVDGKVARTQHPTGVGKIPRGVVAMLQTPRRKRSTTIYKKRQQTPYK